MVVRGEINRRRQPLGRCVETPCRNPVVKNKREGNDLLPKGLIFMSNHRATFVWFRGHIYNLATI